MRIKRSFQIKLLISVFIVSALIPMLILWRLYTNGQHLQTQAIQSNLLTAVILTAAKIDGDKHASLPVGPYAREHPYYWELLDICLSVKDIKTESGDVLFHNVYTLVKSDRPGWGIFVLSDNAQDVGKEFDYGRFPSFASGFDAPSVDDDLTSDEYGEWLSGYAPIFDSSGHVVAVLGLDISGSTVRAIRRDIQILIASSIIVSMILAVVLSHLASLWLSKPVNAITGAMAKLAQGDLKVRSQIHSGDEFEVMSRQFNQLALSLEEREKMKASLAAAQEIQQSLLPNSAPQLPGFDTAGASDYCDETGGDYFDFWSPQQNPEELIAVLGDVSGHGIGPALLMAAARMELRSLASEHSPERLTDVLSTLNRHLCRDVPPGKFLTLFIAVLNANTKTLRWASAGHDAALLYRSATGKFESLSATGIPLGMMDDSSYEPGASVTLQTGDLVVVGTDGIWEARNEQGEMFGSDRFRESIRRLHYRSAAEICRGVIDEVHAFKKSAAQLDDITLIVIRCN